MHGGLGVAHAIIAGQLTAVDPQNHVVGDAAELAGLCSLTRPCLQVGQGRSNATMAQP